MSGVPLNTRSHAAFTSDDHSAINHDGLTINHSGLEGVTADQHHAAAHVLNGANHTVSGLTTGTVLQATGATAFAFTSNFKVDDAAKSLTWGTTTLIEEAANMWALRNGAASQAFRVYNTYSGGGADYERGEFEWSANTLRIGSDQAGTGTARNVELRRGGTTHLSLTGVTRFHVSTDFFTDNAHDIGSSGANRPRTIHVGTSVVIGNLTLASGTLTMGGSDAFTLNAGGSGRIKVLTTGSVLLATAALATTATGGFTYYPSMAGAPTGVPVAETGTIATVIDSTNERLYARFGSTWKYVSFAA